MCTQHLFKKFLLEGCRVPQLSQIYHHIYFRDLNEQLIAANQEMFHYFDAPFFKSETSIPYNQIIHDPSILAAILINDKHVLSSGKIALVNEKLLGGVDFLSIKTPIYAENNIMGLCGITLNFNTSNLTCFADVLVEINKLFQNPAINKELDKLGSDSLTTKPKLTSREQDCLYFYVKGYSSKEIAEKLRLSPRTIECHINNIKSKLGVNKRSELISLSLKCYPELQ